MEKVVFVVELVVVVDVVVTPVVLVVASVVAVVWVVDELVAAVVDVVASVVVVVAWPGGHGFGSHVPLPAGMPPSWSHVAESTSVHVSKAPIADDCTQHWIAPPGHGGQTLGPSSTVPPLASHAAADRRTRALAVQPLPGCSHAPALAPGLQMTWSLFRPHVELAAQPMTSSRHSFGTFSFAARVTQRT